jgi:maltooligosyltrehalose trehalohydrolase
MDQWSKEAKLNAISPWKLGLGANFDSDKNLSFKVWAPKCKEITVIFQEEQKRTLNLKKDESGYFTGNLSNVKPGALYKYLVDNKECFPDPVSRFLPEGLKGPTMVIDPTNYQWNDQNWSGIKIKGQIIYEMHIGAFTSEGTFDAAAKELEELCRLGITLIELMPIAEFPGRWNQGYDGASLYAPSHIYSF